MRVLFSLGTFYFAQIISRDDTGYSWGFISHPVSEKKFKIYIARPEERKHVIGIQDIPAAVFDRCNVLCDKFFTISKKDELFNRLYFLEDPDNCWSKKVEIDFQDTDAEAFIEKNSDLISQYLRRKISGYDNDEKVYTIPSIEEMKEWVEKHEKVKV